MDWENERYVRVYTRDTIDWVALGWEAQALFFFIIRKVDRSGVLEVGKHGARGIAALVGMPAEIVERSLPILIADGCVTITGGLLLIPNFIEAQEAKQSDKQRQKECRERRRSEARSQNVTGPSHNVTESHGRSQPVTDGHSLSLQPSLAVPTQQSEPDSDARARSNVQANEPGKPSTTNVLAMFSAIRAKTCATKALFYQASESAKQKCAALLADMDREAVEDIEPAIQLACEHTRDGVEGWTDGRMKDPNFLWAAIVARWTALREELHGCAPKLAKPQAKDRPAPTVTPIREW